VVPHVQCQEVTALLDTGYEGTATLRNVGKCVPNDDCHIPEDMNRHKNPTRYIGQWPELAGTHSDQF